MKKSGLTPRLLRATVYGANDGIVTTFAVVAGVAGAVGEGWRRRGQPDSEVTVS